MPANTFFSRGTALATTTNLQTTGAVFNDAQRLLEGGLWTTPNDVANQQAYLGQFTADVHAVLNDVTAEVALGAGGQIAVGNSTYTLTAADITALQNVETQLNTMLTNAPTAAGFGAGAAAAQAAEHTADLAVLAEINGDTGLNTVLANNSFAATTGSVDVGFQNLPTGSDSAAALSAATAAGTTLAQVGSVFNAAVDVAIGGLNANNGTLTEFNNDMKAVATGVQNILNNPTYLATIESGETANAAALTTLQLERIENQTQLVVNTVDPLYESNPNQATREINDITLDIIDIVNGDANLSKAAGGTGVASATGGFAEVAGFLTGTTVPYQDNQAQTNAVAQFIAGANTTQNELNAVANGTSTQSIASLITQIEHLNGFIASFDGQQTKVTGDGDFQARFDNELLHGNILAATNSAVQALTAIENGATGAALAADKAQLVAAGDLFHGTATDVGGNNMAVGGVTYNGSSTTVAGATVVAGLAQGTNTPGPFANGTTGLSSNTATTSTTPTMTHHFGGGGFGGFGGGGFGGGGGGAPAPVASEPAPHDHWGFHV